MQKLFEDLRAFIGAFFLLVGIILTITGLVHPEFVEGYNLNLITGLCFLVFASLALLMAMHEKNKNS
jgi:protein-S-isoprenylcysteine O-methyltransferase Ste14